MNKEQLIKRLTDLMVLVLTKDYTAEQTGQAIQNILDDL